MLGTQFATRVLSNLGRHQVSLSPAPCWGPGVSPWSTAISSTHPARHPRRHYGCHHHRLHATAGLSAVSLANAICRVGRDSSAAPLEHFSIGLHRDLARRALVPLQAPGSTLRLLMAINVITTSRGPGSTAQHKPLCFP